MIKAGEKASFSGVLIPELNYRNYKSLEDFKPEFDLALGEGKLPACSEPDSVLDNPIVWGLIGAVLGGVVVVWAHK